MRSDRRVNIVGERIILALATDELPTLALGKLRQPNVCRSLFYIIIL